MEGKILNWYVAVTYKKELSIKRRLNQMSVENFIPERNVCINCFGHKVWVSRPLIVGYVFVHADSETSKRLTMDYGFEMSYIKRPGTFIPEIIPDRQMNDFMRVISACENMEDTIIVTPPLKIGQRVAVQAGPLTGIEGEVVRIKGHKRVLVRINRAVAVATAYIPREFLKLLGNGYE